MSRPRRLEAGGATLMLLAALAACGNVLDAPLPAGTVDPASFHNRAGALARFHELITFAPTAFVTQIVAEGTITDELQDNNLGGFATGSHPLDERLLPELTVQPAGTPPDQDYNSLQTLRGNTTDAIGMLLKYAPDERKAYVGELYALKAFAEIGLADQYCSGIPLSTLDFEKDFTYKPGSPTIDVYSHAVALLDTALTYAADSAQILNLARVGRGRALLAMGRFDDAAAAVKDVPDDFTYAFQVNWSPAPRLDGVAQAPFAAATVADREGTNGLPFLSSGDPRTASSDTGNNRFGRPVYVPVKYQGVAPLTLAGWVEARLIAAEVALHAGNTAAWLADINALRASAITPALADTTDPGTPQGRVELMFRERAMWLFLTGHRQGDLRRLVRQYGRRQEDVFPNGAYPGGQGAYGTDVTLPVPPAERLNPLFTGCINRAS